MGTRAGELLMGAGTGGVARDHLIVASVEEKGRLSADAIWAIWGRRQAAHGPWEGKEDGPFLLHRRG